MNMNADATLDVLLDCKHDLGKYLLLPIALCTAMKSRSSAALIAEVQRG